VILGDARSVLSQGCEAWISDGAPVRDLQTLTEEIAAVRAKWLGSWAGPLDSDSSPISPYRVVREICNVFEPIDSVVTHDSGSPRDQLVPFYRARQPRSYLGWGKSHGLGTGLGLVLGAKLAQPEWAAVHVMGDAAFGMVGLDFETAVREKIPIIAVVLNNSTMAIEEHTMRKSHERYGSRTILGHYADMARAMEGWARKVEHPSEIGPALTEALQVTQDGNPALVEIITAPEQTAFSNRGGTVH
jgi:thiamine pyrophosphate-dependent acetolactate synthase large subunit-like protein